MNSTLPRDRFPLGRCASPLAERDRFRQSPREHQDETDHEVGHCVGKHGRRVRHRDAAFIRSGKIDMIEPDAVGADRAKLRSTRQETAVDPGARRDQYSVRVAERCKKTHIVFCLGRHYGDVKLIESNQRALGERLREGNQDSHRRPPSQVGRFLALPTWAHQPQRLGRADAQQPRVRSNLDH